MGRKPKALVFGATGIQGKSVARELLSRGWAVAAATRNVLSGTELALMGATVIQLDMRDGSAVTTQAEAADAVFIHLPLRPLGTAARGLARLAVAALAPTKRPRIILSTNGPMPMGKARKNVPTMLEGVDEALRMLSPMPVGWHVVTPGLMVEDVFRCSPVTEIVRTNKVRYPLPSDVKVRWTSSRRLAMEVADILESIIDGETPPSFVIPEMSGPVDGAQLAKVIAKAVEANGGIGGGMGAKESVLKFAYEAWDPDEYADTLPDGFDGPFCDAIAELYEYYASKPEVLVPQEATKVPLTAILDDVMTTEG